MRMLRLLNLAVVPSGLLATLHQVPHEFTSGIVRGQVIVLGAIMLRRAPASAEETAQRPQDIGVERTGEVAE